MASNTLGMNSAGGRPLLADHDPSPVRIVNPHGASPFLLIGDHAGNRIPSGLDSLGLGAADLRRHIAWDIGIRGLGACLAEALDAVFIAQVYSRLVVDCNRGPERADAIPEISDGTLVPVNASLSPANRAERLRSVHAPYQAAIAAALEARDRAGRETILVALHSFTPRMDGFDRPWQVGVLHDKGDTRFAMAMLEGLRGDSGLIVGDNQPYQMDGTDHTVPRHAYPASRLYVELEVRQDLLAAAEAQADWSRLLATRLLAARAAMAGARDV